MYVTQLKHCGLLPEPGCAAFLLTARPFPAIADLEQIDLSLPSSVFAYLITAFFSFKSVDSIYPPLSAL